MDELLSKISECVELGKINQATPCLLYTSDAADEL